MIKLVLVYITLLKLQNLLMMLVRTYCMFLGGLATRRPWISSKTRGSTETN